MKKTFLAGLVFLTVWACTAAAQVQYHYHETHDTVRVGYRWQRAQLFSRDSDAVLNLELVNQGDAAVEVLFSVGFYRDQQLFLEARDNRICLRPGQTRRGVRGDLRFSATGITLDDTEEAWFSWDLFGVVVREVAGCDQ
jgi:hypothetical protein